MKITDYIIAAATLTIAFVSYFQWKVDKSTSKWIEKDIMLSRMPTLSLHLHPNILNNSRAGFSETEGGDERWHLPYYITNSSGNYIHNLRYYNEISNDSTFEFSRDTEFVLHYVKQLIAPQDIKPCGENVILRQIIIDKSKEGKKWYRHFVVKYDDFIGTEYVHQTTWEMDEYEIGGGIYWYIIANDRSELQ